ncbi:BLUF domain-containing protein [Loktanella sp. SALINAS62]|uniref:BLUF domain-containing protein n=1 Tax=Loktanella sp. SALINAS62 TaxID=2706124 RepID=UPI0020128962|nr:BLUF domain-containing protein [Loktanella sp. SALINAS62]
MHQIVYVSSSINAVSAEEISSLFKTSRRNNTRDQLTGLLLYHDRLFFQVLEGEETLVRACFDRIKNDRRHGAVSILLDREVKQRAFPECSLGYANPENLSDLGRDATLSLTEVREKSILEASDPVIWSLVATILSSFRDLN